MTRAVRYRTGISDTTGKPLVGWDHVRQSLNKIWLTRPDSRVMRLDFGSTMHELLGEDVTPELALQLYVALVQAAHANEPEYRLSEVQLVWLTSEGGLGLRHAGTYFPEGRLGNYQLAIPVTAEPKLLRAAA